MSYYFTCPGDVTVTSTTVTCSVQIQSVSSPDGELISAEDVGALLTVVLTYWALNELYKQLKRLLQ